MIEEPGSFSGRLISPSPERGPEPIRRMSFADLEQVRRQRRERAMCCGQRAMARQGLELVVGGAEGQAGQGGDFLGEEHGENRDGC